MARYILRFTGPEASPDYARERLANCQDVKIVDESPRMLLVEASPEAINRLTQELPGCNATPERMIPAPKPPWPKLRPS
jgi:hypothetical protein